MALPAISPSRSVLVTLAVIAEVVTQVEVTLKLLPAAILVVVREVQHLEPLRDFHKLIDHLLVIVAVPLILRNEHPMNNNRYYKFSYRMILNS